MKLSSHIDNRRRLFHLDFGAAIAPLESMSFVARRFGSAGLVFSSVLVGTEDISEAGSFASQHSSSGRTRNASRDESGVLRTPFVLIVGVDDEVAGVCGAAAREADVGFLRAPHGPAACRAILDVKPTIVAIGPRLWADERNALTDLADQVGATVIELPRGAASAAQALMLVHAAIGLEDDDDDDTAADLRATA